MASKYGRKYATWLLQVSKQNHEAKTHIITLSSLSRSSSGGFIPLIMCRKQNK